MDSAQAYKAQEARSQSLPPDTKSPAEMLPGAGTQQQNVSSIYLATESAPASPFGSLQSAVSPRPTTGVTSRTAGDVSSSRPARHGRSLSQSVPYAPERALDDAAMLAARKRHPTCDRGMRASALPLRCRGEACCSGASRGTWYLQGTQYFGSIRRRAILRTASVRLCLECMHAICFSHSVQAPFWLRRCQGAAYRSRALTGAWTLRETPY